MTKQNEIENLELEQNNLRKEVASIKAKVPKFLIGFLLVVLLVIYFLENYLYHYFGSGINFIQFMIAIFVVTSTLYVFYNVRMVIKNNAKIKKLSIRLYELMKLNKIK